VFVCVTCFSSYRYRKTRGQASKMSATRARSLAKDLGVHPLLAGNLNAKAEASRVSLISQLQVCKEITPHTDTDGHTYTHTMRGCERERERERERALYHTHC